METPYACINGCSAIANEAPWLLSEARDLPQTWQTALLVELIKHTSNLIFTMNPGSGHIWYNLYNTPPRTLTVLTMGSFYSLDWTTALEYWIGLQHSPKIVTTRIHLASRMCQFNMQVCTIMLVSF